MAEILVPSLGPSLREAIVRGWGARVGQRLERGDLVVSLQAGLVFVDVAAPIGGTLAEILVAPGEPVFVGAALGRIDDSLQAGTSVRVQAAASSDTNPTLLTHSTGPAAPGGGQSMDIAIPQMGESVSEGTLAKWLKKPGEAVKAGDPLAEIETDKVAVEVPAPAAGAIEAVLVKEGSVVSVGTVIATFKAGAGAAAAAAPAAPAAGKAAAAAPAPAPTSSGAGAAPPSVQRIAAEANINPAAIPGTGKDGRPTKADAMAAVAAIGTGGGSSAALVAAGNPRALRTGEERVPMTRLRQTIARRLKEAQTTAAALTTFNEVDMSAVMALRNRYKDVFEKKHGVKLGFMSFFVKACVHALKEVPAVNAEIEGTDIIYKNFYDIGVAVGTEKGLVVPVLRGCDQLSLAGIEKTIAELGKKARDGQLSMSDLQGGTFTISNGGIYGSLMSTPILNPPQSGVMGMHKIQDRAMVVDGQIVVRPMMYLALTYDHRIVDGKEAVTFLVRVKESLEDPERLLLDL